MTQRNHSIDLIRGIAILIMISANAWPYIFPSIVCPFFLRLLFSTAAPLFIFLSGMSINLSLENGKKTSALVFRAFQVLLIGVFIDIFIWNIVPFFTFDVLYLIAFSTFFILLARLLPLRLQIIISLMIIGALFFFKSIYSFELNEIKLNDPSSTYQFTTAVKHMFIDGWFPILPWLGISFLGYILHVNRNKYTRFKYQLLFVGLTLMMLYIILVLLYGGINLAYREGYTEIFYPVNGKFLIYLLGIFSVVCFLINIKFNKLNLISNPGKASLTIYFIHAAIIRYVIPIFNNEETSVSISNSIIILICFYTVIFFLSNFLNKYLLIFKKGKYRLIGFVIGL